MRTSARLRQKKTWGSAPVLLSSSDSVRAGVKVEVKVENEDSDVDVGSCLDDSCVSNDSSSAINFHISMANDNQTVITPKTVANTDVTKPLSIQTKFAHLSMGGGGTGSSTDTASEAGSALSSPACSTGKPSPVGPRIAPLAVRMEVNSGSESGSPEQAVVRKRKKTPKPAFKRKVRHL